jgi:hypothetical protein
VLPKTPKNERKLKANQFVEAGRVEKIKRNRCTYEREREERIVKSIMYTGT